MITRTYRSFSINPAGVRLDIVNYWAVINGSFQDFVGGSAYTLTPVGGLVKLVPDRFGKDTEGAFQTPGSTSSYVQAPAGIYFAGSFSITMWIKLVGDSTILFNFGATKFMGNVQVVSNSGPCESYMAFQLVGYSETNNNNYSSTCLLILKSFLVGGWFHFAATYNLSSLTSSLYLNGELSVNTSGQLPVRNVTRYQNYFGYDQWGYAGAFIYDEIKFHGRTLSPQEVLDDYKYNKSYITAV
jgi:hypothetical protein